MQFYVTGFYARHKLKDNLQVILCRLIYLDGMIINEPYKTILTSVTHSNLFALVVWICHFQLNPSQNWSPLCLNLVVTGY